MKTIILNDVSITYQPKYLDIKLGTLEDNDQDLYKDIHDFCFDADFNNINH